jgi:hypothetical protein
MRHCLHLPKDCFLYSNIKLLFKEKFINLDDMKPFILQRNTAATAAG